MVLLAKTTRWVQLATHNQQDTHHVLGSTQVSDIEHNRVNGLTFP
jgi:hypothetical protein